MKQKHLFYGLAVVLIGSVFFLSQYEDAPVVPPVEQVQTEQVPAGESAPVSLSFTAVADGQSALDLLQESTQVEYKEYDFGVLVTAINGVQADSEHYWALYINDEYATAGASETILKTGDIMTWKYEAISQAPLE